MIIIVIMMMIANKSSLGVKDFYQVIYMIYLI